MTFSSSSLHPAVAVSESALAKFPGEKIGGLPRLAFRLGPDGEAEFSGDASAELLLAIVETQAERDALEKHLVDLGTTAPPALVAPRRDEALERIGEALVARAEAAARDPQGLVLLRFDETGDPADAIAIDAPFEWVTPLDVRVPGLVAIALHVAGEGLAPDDGLEVAFINARGETLGDWRIPARAIPGALAWLALDFPSPLAETPGKTSLVVRGKIGESGAKILISTARGDASRPAARLFATRAAHPAASPLWLWPGADGRPGVPASRLDDASWRDARLLGQAVEEPAPAGGKRMRIEAGQAALLVFSDIELARGVAITARVVGDGEEPIAVALALIPADETGDDADKIQQAALAWSAPHRVGPDGAALSLVLPPDAPRVAHVGLSFRHLGAAGAPPAVLSCADLWLAPRRIQKPSFVRDGAARFETVRLDGVFANEAYRHIDVSMDALSKEGRLWPKLKFKFFEDGDISGFEFRSGDAFPTMFATWPGTETDDYSPYFKVLGAQDFDAAVAGLARENDRLMLVALKAALPSIVRKLGETYQLDPDAAQGWLERAERFVAAP